MIKYLKMNIKYIIIFIFSFFSMSFFFGIIDGDVLWNYGFSYAISKGEMPYIDFNMIITPFYPFLMSLFLKIFSHNIVVFYLVNSTLITIMFSFLFKLYSYKIWLLLVFLFFPLPSVVFPSYNLFLLFLFVLLIYFEKEGGSDYLIGLLLGLCFLTKQSVGLFLCLPSFYFLFSKNYDKLLKRVVSFLIPCIIFFIYLFISKSFSSFLDLCFFGMFDFTKSNGKSFNILFFLVLIMIVLILIRIIKDRDNLINYYVLAFSTITIPLFDINHFEFFLFTFLFLYIDYFIINIKQLVFCSVIFSIFYILMFFHFSFGNRITYPNHYKNFQMRFLYNGNGEFKIRDRVINYINNNRDKNIVILSSEAYFYKITNEMDINYFDLLNKGNHGYNGTEKLIKRINLMNDDTIFIVSFDEYVMVDKYDRQQINKDVIKYVIDNGEVIDSIDCFKVYKLKTSH